MKTKVWMGSLLALGLLACGGPKGFVIQGEVTGLPDSTQLFLINIENGTLMDSAWVMGDCFQLEGFFEAEPQSVRMDARVNGKEIREWYQSMVIGNESITIKGDTSDFPTHLTVSGSKYQDQWTEFMSYRLASLRERDSLLVRILKLGDDPQQETEVKALMQQMSAIDRKADSLEENYLFTHPNTYPGLRCLSARMYTYSKDTVRMLFDQMSPDLQNRKYGKPIRTYIETESVSIGAPFLDFEAEDQQGNRVRLSDFVGKDGKYVLLDFTASGCGPCIQTNQAMRQMVNTYSDSLQIVSFSQDRSRETWLNSVQRDSIGWPFLWSAEEVDRGVVSVPYQVRGTPTFFVIDPQGKIVQKWSGYGKDIFDKKIGRLKNKP